MFSTNSSKICCSFAKNNFFEKSKMARPVQIALGNILVQFGFISNFFGRQQLLATEQRRTTFWETHHLLAFLKQITGLFVLY